MLLQVVCNYVGHFTPEELHRALEAQGRSMALTTIYRNLPALEEAGIIRRTTFLEETRRGAVAYEHAWGRTHHDHLVCRECGREVEFNYDALEVLQEEVARKHGFTLLKHHMELVGLCPECNASELAVDPQRTTK